MRIKCARGPLANKRYVVEQNWAERWEVSEPKRVDFWSMAKYPEALDVCYRRGHYQRSNVTLKDGTVVFEWMGWRV